MAANEMRNRLMKINRGSLIAVNDRNGNKCKNGIIFPSGKVGVLKLNAKKSLRYFMDGWGTAKSQLTLDRICI